MGSTHPASSLQRCDKVYVVSVCRSQGRLHRNEVCRLGTKRYKFGWIPPLAHWEDLSKFINLSVPCFILLFVESQQK